MKRTHLVIGGLLFIAFCVSGKLMRVYFPDKEIIPQDLRLLMRSRHIYILFASLLNLLLAVYLTLENDRRLRAMQYAGSFFVAFSGFVVIYGWWVETFQLQHFSDISRQGIYASLAGVGLHLIAGLGRVVSSKR